MLCSVDNERGSGEQPERPPEGGQANEVWSANWAEPAEGPAAASAAAPAAPLQGRGFLLPPTGPSPASDCHSGLISSPSLSCSDDPDDARHRCGGGAQQQLAMKQEAPRMPVGLRLAKALDKGILTPRAHRFGTSLQAIIDPEDGKDSSCSLYVAALARTAARAVVRAIRDAEATAGEGCGTGDGEAAGDRKARSQQGGRARVSLSQLAARAGISPLLLDDFRRTAEAAANK